MSRDHAAALQKCISRGHTGAQKGFTRIYVGQDYGEMAQVC